MVCLRFALIEIQYLAMLSTCLHDSRLSGLLPFPPPIPRQSEHTTLCCLVWSSAITTSKSSKYCFLWVRHWETYDHILITSALAHYITLPPSLSRQMKASLDYWLQKHEIQLIRECRLLRLLSNASKSHAHRFDEGWTSMSSNCDLLFCGCIDRSGGVLSRMAMEQVEGLGVTHRFHSQTSGFCDWHFASLQIV